MTSSYYKQLDDASKARYVEKLTYDGEFLPDPLDEDIRLYTFSRNLKLWPSIHFGDVYMYLVEKECSYTKERFRNYKALESYNYFLSGKVINILAYKRLDICIITCNVQASQTLKTYHKPWIVAQTNGVICSGHCTCMAGLGEVCAHVAGLLFALETATREGSPSPTSVLCTWNKSVKEVKPSAAVDINFYHKRLNPYKRSCVALQMPSTSAYNSFLDVIKENKPDAAILNMLSDEDTSTASETEAQHVEENVYDSTTLPKENIPNLIEFYKQLSMSIPCNIDENEKKNIFIENTIFSAQYISNVESSTRTQMKNPMWFHFRKGRITASLFGRVLKCISGHKGIVSTILQQNQTFYSSAMKYGQMNEENAKRNLKEYLEEQHVNAEFLPTGFLIDKDYGFLGATPDGMVVCDCCDSALVEIKCPARGKGLKIKDIEKKNFFLDEDLCLRRNHNYYDQVQGQMNIWSINKCYFVTYTDVDIHIQTIEYDNDYWNLRKYNLITFFKEHVLEEILKNISDQ